MSLDLGLPDVLVIRRAVGLGGRTGEHDALSSLQVHVAAAWPRRARPPAGPARVHPSPRSPGPGVSISSAEFLFFRLLSRWSSLFVFVLTDFLSLNFTLWLH